jgi:hypothetical protein
MQTSFMHPPFGFALFYLRSVAPAREFLDKITGKPTAPITTGQIYWGAVPFVVIQCIMVAIVIAFPGLVTANLDRSRVDESTIEISVPATDYEGQRREDAGQGPGEQQRDEASGASELEKAFGGDPAGGDTGTRDESDATDLEKDFLK